MPFGQFQRKAVTYVDAMLSRLQADSYENQSVRSHLVQVWVGLVTIVVKVIEYYLPTGFPKRSGKWIPPDQLERKSA